MVRQSQNLLPSILLGTGEYSLENGTGKLLLSGTKICHGSDKKTSLKSLVTLHKNLSSTEKFVMTRNSTMDS